MFDTVASVGILIPRDLPFTATNYITKTFRHAVSLDEHRAKFRSNLWHREVSDKTMEGVQAPTSGVFRTIWNKIKAPFVSIKLEEEKEQEEEWENAVADTEEEGEPTDVKEVWFAGCHCGENIRSPAYRFPLTRACRRWRWKRH